MGRTSCIGGGGGTISKVEDKGLQGTNFTSFTVSGGGGTTHARYGEMVEVRRGPFSTMEEFLEPDAHGPTCWDERLPITASRDLGPRWPSTPAG